MFINNVPQHTVAQIIAATLAYKNDDLNLINDVTNIDDWNRYVNEAWLLLEELQSRGIYDNPADDAAFRCKSCGQIHPTKLAAAACDAWDQHINKLDKLGE